MKNNTESIDIEFPIVNLKELHITLDQPFPLQLDYFKIVEKFISSQILKSNQQQEIVKTVNELLQEKLVVKLLQLSLELVILIKFNDIKILKELLDLLKKKISQAYVKLLIRIPNPKYEIINHLTFSISYMTHFVLWKISPYELRQHMDLRFVFDCYHILLYFFNGIYVSDSFVRVNIERIFITNQFLSYEKEIFMTKESQQQTKSIIDTLFGQKIVLPELSFGCEQFRSELNKKLEFLKQKISYEDSHSKSMKSNLKHYDSVLLDEEALQKSQTIMLQNIQINVNQISPNVQQVLQLNSMAIPMSKKKLVSHNYEKPVNSDKVFSLMKKMNQQSKDIQDSKVQKKLKKNLFEIHDVQAPAKEFYQRNDKVDGLFKDMLELNHVLKNRQQSFNNLYSSKELRKNKEEEILQKDPLQLDIKKRLLNIVTMNEIPKRQHNSQVQLNYMIQNSQLITNEGESIQEEGSKKYYLAPIKSLQKDHKTSKSQQDIYDNKSKFYNQKYNWLQEKSTDLKINTLQQSIQQKQHLMDRSLAKRIHKM